jgi:hypothetical protein
MRVSMVFRNFPDQGKIVQIDSGNSSEIGRRVSLVSGNSSEQGKKVQIESCISPERGMIVTSIFGRLSKREGSVVIIVFSFI